MTTHSAPHIESHPDLAAMSARYEEISESRSAQFTDSLLVLAGLFVALSPWIVGFHDVSVALAMNNLVVGLVIAALGVGYAAAFDRTHRLTFLCPLLGVWTIVAVWLVSGTVLAMATIWTNVIAGAVVVLLGFAAMMPYLRMQRSRK
ncbi:SPW repeat protein [Hoyosella sp. YIM 151337]|uniref:SPW repeat protein n=1 Tax=Hoyosella sp. YIM 151337 TaxID=2992742 RepID=UPI0022363AAD|nr:SPW repeat protein [Hoyosella sp. YIM 151337]MCW4352208.1 SPW repeat protein [Hoyosella sp. YIM 151337]